ncbi:MAG TPA: hypothetical protein VHJ38_10280 [Nitrososphaeraceae archaeon]|nr:hypothetical protein [Nitrososphaeraceae archaeon]
MFTEPLEFCKLKITKGRIGSVKSVAVWVTGDNLIDESLASYFQIPQAELELRFNYRYIRL